MSLLKCVYDIGSVNIDRQKAVFLLDRGHFSFYKK